MLEISLGLLEIRPQVDAIAAIKASCLIAAIFALIGLIAAWIAQTKKALVIFLFTGCSLIFLVHAYSVANEINHMEHHADFIKLVSISKEIILKCSHVKKIELLRSRRGNCSVQVNIAQNFNSREIILTSAESGNKVLCKSIDQFLQNSSCGN